MLDARKLTFDMLNDYKDTAENKMAFYKQFLDENILDVLDSKQKIRLQTAGEKINIKDDGVKESLKTYLSGNAGFAIQGESVFISDNNYLNSCYFSVMDDSGNEVIRVRGEDDISFMITPNKELSPFDNEVDYNNFAKVVAWLNEAVRNVYTFV